MTTITAARAREIALQQTLCFNTPIGLFYQEIPVPKRILLYEIDSELEVLHYSAAAKRRLRQLRRYVDKHIH